MRNRKYFRRAIKVQLFSYLIEKKREIFYLFFNSVEKKIFEKALKDVIKIIKQHLSLRPYTTQPRWTIISKKGLDEYHVQGPTPYKTAGLPRYCVQHSTTVKVGDVYTV